MTIGIEIGSSGGASQTHRSGPGVVAEPLAKRVTGGRMVAGTAASATTGKSGKKMRFGEWGGLHALRDLRIDVVG